MLINFFKSKKTTALITMFGIFILELVLFLRKIDVPDLAYHKWSFIDLGPVYHNQLLFKGLMLLSLLLTGVVVLRIAYHQVLTEQSNYLSLFFFLLLSPILLKIAGVGPVVLVLFPLVLAIKRLFALYQTEKDYKGLYDIGLLISLASLLYMPAIVFVLAIPHALRVYNVSFPRHIVIALFGILTPYLFLGVYAYWMDSFEMYMSCKMHYLLELKLPIYTQVGYHEMGVLVILLILSLIGVFGFLQTLVDRSIKQRKATGIIGFYALLAMISVFVGAYDLRQYMLLLLLPFALFVADFFLKKRKPWVNDVVLLLLIGLIALNILPIL